MSRHEGVSCDSCLKANFRGRRYKCLVCYDYDLCATCYESGATTGRHNTEHPMQCILTRTDFDLYYGGEALSPEQPQSFTCPYCSKMGLTEILLLEHVTAEHADAAAEVVCPICAALPSGEPNYVTDDFTAHLTLEHRAPREVEEPVGGIPHVRRIPHPGRGVSGPRTRRTNMHFQSAGAALSGLTTSNRDTMDPIAELLSQLSSVRSRAAAAQSVSSQLQQLEMQLQSTRQQLERLPRRQVDSSRSAANGIQAPVLDLTSALASCSNNNPTSSSSNSGSQFLLAKYNDTELSEAERQVLEVERADRSAFVQELLLSSLAEHLRLDPDDASNVLFGEIEDVEVRDLEVLPKRESRGRRHEEINDTMTRGLNAVGSNEVLAPSSQLPGCDNHGNKGKLSKEATQEHGRSLGRGSVNQTHQNSH